jgi:AcrR family transcriptional regulator
VSAQKSSDGLVKPNSSPSAKTSGKRELNKKLKIKAICAAGLRLYVDHGIANVTVDEIVMEAGVAKGSFYRYYENQEALVVAIMAPLRDAIRDAIMTSAGTLSKGIDKGTIPAKWLELAGHVGTAIFANQDVARLYLQESRGPAVDNRKPIAELANQLSMGAVLLTTLAQKHGFSRADYNPRVSALIVVGAVERLLAAFLGGADLGDPAKIPATLIATILDGVRPKE